MTNTNQTPSNEEIKVEKRGEISRGIVSLIMSVLSIGSLIYLWITRHDVSVFATVATPILSFFGASTGFGALTNPKKDRPALGAIGLAIGLAVLGTFGYLLCH